MQSNNQASTVQLRDCLASLPAYVAGKSAPGDVVKLSSNENPYPPLPQVAQAIAQAPQPNRYPDMQANPLIDAIAAHHQISPSTIATGNGSVAVLAHVLAAVAEPGREVIIPWRSFEAYPICIQLTGAKTVKVPLADGGKIDLPAMAASITPATCAVMLCTPNNPTGPALTQQEVRQFLSQVPPQVLVVLDEAYLEFVNTPAVPFADALDGLALVEEYTNVATLRTFSKAYSLAGLRVGYLVGRPELASAVRTASTPFGVNIVAQAAAQAALQPEALAGMRQVIAQIVPERERVRGELLQRGWPVPVSQGNFVWLPFPAAPSLAQGRSAPELATALAELGVLVRPFPEGIRVTISTPSDNNRFLAALTQVTQTN